MGDLILPPVLVATRSAHKLAEIREIMDDVPVRFLSLLDLGLSPSPAEDELEPFDTFALNAMSKAKYFHGRTGLPTLADDSGLCVDALEGGPGVRTKRFAPESWAREQGRDRANNLWLLDQLTGVPPEERGARYRCAIAVTDDCEHDVYEGSVEGRIALEPRGEGGFGYDPLFLLHGGEKTYAELPPETKKATSHRAAALRRTIPWLMDHVAEGRRAPTAG